MRKEETWFVVTRDRRRVSKKNYDTRDEAYPEASYWTKIIHKWDPKSLIRIVETDKLTVSDSYWHTSHSGSSIEHATGDATTVDFSTVLAALFLR